MPRKPKQTPKPPKDEQPEQEPAEQPRSPKGAEPSQAAPLKGEAVALPPKPFGKVTSEAQAEPIPEGDEADAPAVEMQGLVEAPPVTKKEESVLTTERVLIYKRSRYNPIKGVNAGKLSTYIDSFKAGTLREFARLQDEIASKDSRLKAVIPKRDGALNRRQWEIVENPHADCSKETKQAHKDALRFFYDRLSVTDAVDQNVRGGVGTLVKQVVRGAVGFKYSVHEILWRPSAEGLTAKVVHVPLWFFENHIGRLRFLLTDFAWDGIDLDEGGWMVATGDHLMLPCSVCWMFKQLGLKDWNLYNERYGIPARVGKTNQAVGSAGWNALKSVVQNLGNDFAGIINKDEEVAPFNFAATGEPPMPKLVDYLDREMTAIWRGGDMSTVGSSPDTVGASLQGEESYILEASDATLVNETFNENFDRAVIGWAFGRNVQPAAYFKIVVPPPRNIASELQIDNFLLGVEGGSLPKEETYERYGRSIPDENDEVLTAKPPPQNPMFPGAGGPVPPGGEEEQGEQEFDKDGNPVLDEDGNPVFKEPEEGNEAGIEGAETPPKRLFGRPFQAGKGFLRGQAGGGRKPPFNREAGGFGKVKENEPAEPAAEPAKKPMPPWLKKRFGANAVVPVKDVGDQLASWMNTHVGDAEAVGRVKQLRRNIVLAGPECIAPVAVNFANDGSMTIEGNWHGAAALALEGADEIPVKVAVQAPAKA